MNTCTAEQTNWNFKMSKRNKHVRVDADKAVARAMKQVEKAMKHVKVATGGMGNFDFGDSGMTDSSDDNQAETRGAEAKMDKDGSIRVEKGTAKKKTSIHIHNSKNVQIGDNNVMVINQTSKSRRTRRRDDTSSDSSDSESEDVPKVTKAAQPDSEICQSILTSSRIVNDQDIRRATTMIGKSWRRVGRGLQLSDVDMEQIHAQYFREEGIRGVVHYMLTKWRTLNAKKATIGTLTTVLLKFTDSKEIQVNFEP